MTPETAAVCASLLPNVAGKCCRRLPRQPSLATVAREGAPGLMRASSSAGQSARLISVRSEVQILPGPPLAYPPFRGQAPGGRDECRFPGAWLGSRDAWLLRRGCSSVGRAPALQAGGHRFDPVHLHWPPLLRRSALIGQPRARRGRGWRLAPGIWQKTVWLAGRAGRRDAAGSGGKRC